MGHNYLSIKYWVAAKEHMDRRLSQLKCQPAGLAKLGGARPGLCSDSHRAGKFWTPECSDPHTSQLLDAVLCCEILDTDTNMLVVFVSSITVYNRLRWLPLKTSYPYP